MSPVYTPIEGEGKKKNRSRRGCNAPTSASSSVLRTMGENFWSEAEVMDAGEGRRRRPTQRGKLSPPWSPSPPRGTRGRIFERPRGERPHTRDKDELVKGQDRACYFDRRLRSLAGPRDDIGSWRWGYVDAWSGWENPAAARSVPRSRSSTDSRRSLKPRAPATFSSVARVGFPFSDNAS